jgi:hypothetical protein
VQPDLALVPVVQLLDWGRFPVLQPLTLPHPVGWQDTPKACAFEDSIRRMLGGS